MTEPKSSLIELIKHLLNDYAKKIHEIVNSNACHQEKMDKLEIVATRMSKFGE